MECQTAGTAGQAVRAVDDSHFEHLRNGLLAMSLDGDDLVITAEKNTDPSENQIIKNPDAFKLSVRGSLLGNSRSSGPWSVE